MKRLYPVVAAFASFTVAAPAHAGEIFGGVYAHDVDTFLTHSGIEGGADIQLGYRFDRLGASPLQPYGFVAVNTAGETHYGAIGLSARFGDRIFVRPGLGIALHTGSSANFSHPDHDHVDFGSRVLLAPELGLGARVTDRLSIEASWVHLSHAQLLGRQNPGIDNIGVRLTFDIP